MTDQNKDRNIPEQPESLPVTENSSEEIMQPLVVVEAPGVPEPAALPDQEAKIPIPVSSIESISQEGLAEQLEASEQKVELQSFGEAPVEADDPQGSLIQPEVKVGEPEVPDKVVVASGRENQPPAITEDLQNWPVEASRPTLRLRLTALWITLAVVVFLALLVVGGYFGYRSYASNLVIQAKIDFQARNYAAAETTINKRFGLPLQNLLVPADELVVIRGKAVYKQGRAEQALPDLDAGKGTNPSDGEPYLYMAEIYLKHGMYAEALAQANEAQKRNDQWSLPYALQSVQAYQELRYGDALATAEAAIQRSDPAGMAYRVRGSVLAWQEDLSGAEADLNQAIELDASDTAAMAMRAMIYFKLERESDAAKDVDAIVAAAPESADALWAQAMSAIFHNDAAGAQDLLNQAIKLDDQRPEFYLYLSFTTLRTDQQKDGLADIDQALALNPDWAEAIYSRDVYQFNGYETVDIDAEVAKLEDLAPKGLFASHLVVDQGIRLMEYQNALDAAEKIISAYPEVSDGYTTRGDVYLDQHELNKAAADYDKAAQINPLSVMPLIGQAQVFIAQRQYNKAQEVLAKAIEVAPQAAALHALRAHVYLAQKDEDKASQEIDAAFKLDSSSIDTFRTRALFNLGKKYKDNLQAMSDINKVGELYPNAPEAMIIRAFIYLDNKDYDRAREELLKAQQIDDNDSMVYTGLAQADVAQKKNDSAVVNAKKAVELAPWSEDTYLILGQAYLQSDKPEDAITNLKKSLEINPDQTAIYFSLYEAHQKLDDYDASLEDLNTLLAQKDELTLEQVDTVEKQLAYLKDNPPPPLGFLAYRDEKNGFKLFYQAEWHQGTIKSDDKYARLILDQTSRQGDAEIILSFDSTNGDKVTSTEFSDYVRGVVSQKGETFIKREMVKTPNYKGIVDTYTYWAVLSDGTSEKIVHKITIFIVGDKIITFQLFASEGWSEDIVTQADDIVQSFKLF